MSGVMARSNTTQALLDRVRLDIILRRYEDGEPLRELDVAARYGASRAAVRNAMIVLEQEGLIRSFENGTKKIKLLTMDDIDDLYDLRSYIENKAIEQIFDRPNRDFSKLMEIINQLSAMQNSPESEILSLDTAFHREMVVDRHRQLAAVLMISEEQSRKLYSSHIQEGRQEKTIG